MDIRIKKVNENAKIPTRGSNYAAGYDLYAPEKVDVHGGETVFVDTGIAVEIPEGYFGAVYARSGLACKHNLRPANCVGIIDSDFRGTIKVAIFNDRESVQIAYRPIPGAASTYMDAREPVAVPNKDASFTIEAGDRIAQLIIQKFEEVNFVEVDELEDSARGEGGFGSTGVN